jgi:hypothetical protein
MTTNYYFPKVATCKSVAEYFKDFVELNKEHPRFTFRNFGEAVGWPHSYLGDLVAGRKPLTVSRVLEFAKFASFTPLETERLLLMSFVVSENTHVSEFFSEKLNQTCDLDLKISSNLPAPDFAVDPLTETSTSLLVWARLPLSDGKV